MSGADGSEGGGEKAAAAVVAVAVLAGKAVKAAATMQRYRWR